MPDRIPQTTDANGIYVAAASPLHHESHAASGKISERLLQLWPMKLILGIVLTLAFCIGYFGLQHWHVGTPRRLPLTAIDHAVPFSPAWAIVYQSIYLMLPVAWLAVTRQQLIRYTVGFVILSATGFAYFAMVPTICPRIGEPATGLLGLIQRYDSPLNAFPSLHMGLATYSAAFFVWLMRPHLSIVAGLVIWILLIAYATMATKQHYFIDLPAGVLLGFASFVLSGLMRRSISSCEESVQ